MKKIAFIVFTALAFPSMAFAQSLGRLDTLLQSIGDLIAAATPIVVGLALLAFFWGLATFIFSAGNEDAKDRGKNIMIWGIIALFVMVSVWGIINFIQEALDVEGGEVTVPAVPGI